VKLSKCRAQSELYKWQVWLHYNQLFIFASVRSEPRKYTRQNLNNMPGVNCTIIQTALDTKTDEQQDSENRQTCCIGTNVIHGGIREVHRGLLKICKFHRKFANRFCKFRENFTGLSHFCQYKIIKKLHATFFDFLSSTYKHTIKNMKMKINELCIWHIVTWRWLDDDW